MPKGSGQAGAGCGAGAAGGQQDLARAQRLFVVQGELEAVETRALDGGDSVDGGGYLNHDTRLLGSVAQAVNDRFGVIGRWKYPSVGLCLELNAAGVKPGNRVSNSEVMQRARSEEHT